MQLQVKTSSDSRETALSPATLYRTYISCVVDKSNFYVIYIMFIFIHAIFATK